MGALSVPIQEVNMNKKHLRSYVYWRTEAKTIRVKIDEGKYKLNYYKNNGIKAQTKTLRAEWMREGTYSLERVGYWRHLYVREDGQYKRYMWHSGDDRKNTPEYNTNEGLEAIQIIHDAFKNRTGRTFLSAFGYSDAEELRPCVPRQFYYIKENAISKNINNVNKVDYSSHYPANCCGVLPTMKDCLRVNGVVEPCEKYPFAFYIKSGHCAEYGRFDTRLWGTAYKLGESLLFDNGGKKIYKDIDAQEEITILCKTADFELTEEFNHFYDLKKKGDAQAKLVMNATIGYFHPKTNRKSFRLFHVAAICLARANQKVLELTEELGARSVLQVITDCVIYCGYPRCGVRDKQLGALMKEIDCATFRMRGTNQYIFMRDNKVITTSHSGFNDNLKCEKLEDIDNWRKI